MATEIIGSIKFKVEDKLLVADPCYIDENDSLEDLDNLGVILDDCAGDWEATVTHNRDGRIKELKVVRANGGAREYAPQEKVGDNSVDSGQMFIGCKSSFPLKYEDLLNCYKLPNGEWNDDHLGFLAFAEGAVSSTGYGDGVYPVLVRQGYDKRIAEVLVIFDDPDGDYEEEE